MKLYERLGDPGFHTSIITTFCIDFDAYESIALSRLRGAGCRNNLVLVDQQMLTHALSGASLMPNEAGRQYSISGVQARGVFHPKIILQFGRDRGRAIIGSANATASGLAGNIEVAGVLECTDEPSGAQQLIASTWEFVRPLLDRQRNSAAEQVTWMQARTPWLRYARPESQLETLADGNQAAFFSTSRSTGILERFVSAVGSERVDLLVVVSPYWDEDLAALRELIVNCAPKRTRLLIDAPRALFPGAALSGLQGTEIVDLGPWCEGRFIHAKLIVVRTETADHVLYGSANCTVAALGRVGFAGSNEEACLYRRFPPHVVIEALELQEILESGSAPKMLPPFARPSELAIDELTQRSPGTFEGTDDVLTWFQPPGIVAACVQTEFLDRRGEPVQFELTPLDRDTSNNVTRFRVPSLLERPSFARLRFEDGALSGRAVVAWVDALLSAAREATSPREELAIRRLARETEIDLALLEVLDNLEADELAEGALFGRQRHHQRDETVEGPLHQVLDYQSFMAGGRIRPGRSARGRDSLLGSEQSFVRSYLNRVLGLSSSQSVEDPAAVIESEESFSSGRDAHRRGPDEANNPATPRESTAARRAIQKQIAQAVQHISERIKSRSRSRGLTTQDLLRLRAVLVVIMAYGSADHRTERGADMTWPNTSPRQVLSFSDDGHGWPRLLARCVHALFGGNPPAILSLKIDIIHDQLPADLLECWATCFWAVRASHAANQKLAVSPRFSRSLDILLDRVYELTALAPHEALGESVTEVMTKLGDRFAGRLGIEPGAIMDAHRRAANRLPRGAYCV